MEKQIKLEWDNKHLLEWMTDIIVKPQPLYPSNTHWGGSVNQREAPVKSSLNADFRWRELERITKENYKLLKWLQGKKSSMDVIKWEIERWR